MSVIPAETTTIGISDDGVSYTTLAQVLSIDPPGGTVAEVETTHLNSTAKSFRPSLIPEVGEVAFRIEYDPNDAGHQELAELAAAPATKFWKITYPDGEDTPANDVFQGFLTEFDPDGMEVETNMEADVTIRVTGPVTRNPGTSA